MADALTDELDRTARQVRMDDIPEYNHLSTVHRAAASWSDPWSGVVYRTVCCQVLAKAEGAILTTREATCGRCLAGG